MQMCKKNITIKSITSFLVILLLPSTAFAAASFDEILANLQEVIPAFVALALIVSYLGGIYFIMRGLMMLKAFGMPLTQMSRPGELGGPLGYLVVGTILLYLPTTLETSVFTFLGFGDDYIGGSGRAAEVIYGYGSGTTDEQWDSLKGIVFKYVNFIGLIAFIRGWFNIAKAGQPGVQPGSVSKGLVHIIAGIIAINIQAGLEIIRATIGI